MLFYWEKEKIVMGMEHGVCLEGHLEYGESVIECAKRELKEELGIEGLELKLISVIDNIDERGHYVHISFLLTSFHPNYYVVKDNPLFQQTAIG